MPGVGMCPPKRYTASKASANRSRLRRSGTRKTFVMASRNFMPVDSWFYTRVSLTPDHFRRAAGRLNLFQSRLRENIRLHGDLALQLARAEHLQTVLLQLANHTQLKQ